MRGWTTMALGMLMAAGLGAGLFGCDDIERPMSDPFLRAKEEPGKNYHLATIRQINKSNLERFYNFLVENRTVVNEKMAAIMNIKDSDPDGFAGRAGMFKDQSHDLYRRVEMQEELMDLNREQYPETHPAKLLFQASYFFKQEILQYQRTLAGREKLDPEADRKVSELLGLSREALDRFGDEDLK